MSDSKGVHLTDILDSFRERGFMVGWPGYIQAGVKQGWKEKTILSRVREGISDVYGKDWYDGWLVSYERWRDQSSPYEGG